MLPDNFMKHFRWITPLLLAFSVYMLQDIYVDFKKQKNDAAEERIRSQAQIASLQTDIAVIKTYLTKRIDR